MNNYLKEGLGIGIISFFFILFLFLIGSILSNNTQKEICNRYSTEYNIQTEVKDTGLFKYGMLCYIKTDKGDIKASDFSIAEIATPLRK